MSAIVVLVLRILLVACLYGFVVWAMLAIWRDLRTQGQFISAPMIPNLSIQQDNRQLSFHGPEIIIGRSATSDYPIPDETVSARHARLSYHHNQWWLQDLNSTNGTFLNDERVSLPTVVASGDELKCGQIGLLIEINEKGHHREG